MNAVARDAARAQRRAVADYNRQLREQERARKAAERYQRQFARDMEKDRKQAEREAKQQYLEDRLQEAQDANDALAVRIEELQSILQHTLEIEDTIDFGALRITEEFKPFKPPTRLTSQTPKPQQEHFTSKITAAAPVGFFEKLFHGEHGKGQRVLRHQEEQTRSSLINTRASISAWHEAKS